MNIFTFLLIHIVVELKRGLVLRRKRDEDSNPYSTRHRDPILDIHEYDVEFDDGELGYQTPNNVAASMNQQVDLKVHENLFMKKSVITTPLVKQSLWMMLLLCHVHARKLLKTTIGWVLLCIWKDISLTWVPLKYLKESNPIEVAEYTIKNNLSEKLAFSQWVDSARQVRDRCI